ASLPYHLVITDVVSGGYADQLDAAGVDGATIVDRPGRRPAAPDGSVLRLRVAGGRIEMITRDRTGADARSPVGVADRLSVPEAEALARQPAPLRPAGGGRPGGRRAARDT